MAEYYLYLLSYPTFPLGSRQCVEKPDGRGVTFPTNAALHPSGLSLHYVLVCVYLRVSAESLINLNFRVRDRVLVRDRVKVRVRLA